MPDLRCKPVITDEELPEGLRCSIYEDGRGTAWFLVNRAALLADPEGLVTELVEHCDAVAVTYEHSRAALAS